MGVVSAWRRLGGGDLDRSSRTGSPYTGPIVTAGIAALALLLASSAPVQAESPSNARAASLLATATQPVTSFAAEDRRNTVAGFRMEGAPQVEVVFGDIATYKKQIDSFSALQSEMNAQRKLFATATHQVQMLLGPVPKVGAKRARKLKGKALRQCPTDAIAQSVSTASKARQRYRRLGVAMEGRFHAIRDLHELGESTGLTPDYRSRVIQSRPAYLQALSDLSEMNAVMRLQVEPELQRRGCKTELLIAHAATQAATAKTKALDESTDRKAAPEVPGAPSSGPVVEARAVTFFIDNRACSGGLDVYVDATLLGHVAAKTQAAFQSLSGRHSLCLLEEGKVASCGDTGTVRTAFVHDGFQIQRSCQSSSK